MCFACHQRHWHILIRLFEMFEEIAAENTDNPQSFGFELETRAREKLISAGHCGANAPVTQL